MLAALELVNIPLQAAIWFWWIGFPLTGTNAAGFALVALMLVQGAAYWVARLRQMERPGSSLPGRRWFALARRVDVPVLAAGVIVAVLKVIDEPGAGTIPGLAFAVFACLEYVNYFHVQLMYDTRADLGHLFRHGFRRAHLARDLDGDAAGLLGKPAMD